MSLDMMLLDSQDLILKIRMHFSVCSGRIPSSKNQKLQNLRTRNNSSIYTSRLFMLTLSSITR
ncbi:unnamed protein product [Eruca vesicaria subsp. sativa]|uniref:Uncharacterized protein n=1 Tax=Eruca vesicaria subsp. sativa TaxID=29727 RepID=A0ABC8KQF8_ERUVS|nr:unnamed protein product [Eruca vesicaria subsp. sativa]